MPLANPQQAAIVSSPRIFSGPDGAAAHGEAPEDIAAQPEGARRGRGSRRVHRRVSSARSESSRTSSTQPLLDSIVKARGGTGAPTAADSATLRGELSARHREARRRRPGQWTAARFGPHAVPRHHGLSGARPRRRRVRGLRLPARHPRRRRTRVRIGAVADSNFSYWHSATFNNDGTKILFSDEWGGGGAPKCRATDQKEWGANAIFTVENGKMKFQSYYKLPAAQTAQENCVAHNGSLIPIPGRDVMVQAWYQGGISVFDWTDAGASRSRSRTSIAARSIRRASATRRLVVGVLVQRRDRQLRDRARPRRRRADAERVRLAERDRRGEDGALRLLQRAGAAEVRLAAELRAGARVRRPARAEQVPQRDAHRGSAGRIVVSRAGRGSAAS